MGTYATALLASRGVVQWQQQRQRVNRRETERAAQKIKAAPQRPGQRARAAQVCARCSVRGGMLDTSHTRTETPTYISCAATAAPALRVRARASLGRSACAVYAAASTLHISLSVSLCGSS